MSGVRFERLARRHDRGGFSCGRKPLDDFLRFLSGQYGRRSLARTYVGVEGEAPRVLGYYSLSAGSLEVADLPEIQAHRLPEHPVPVVLLARLAVDSRAQRRGLGRDLLVDALARVAAVAEIVGIHAVEVEALDQTAANFYRKYGFVDLRDDPHHLYYPVSSIPRIPGDDTNP